jgi:hypothetical protein
MKESKIPFGLFSMLGSFVLFGLIAWSCGVFPILFGEIGSFLSGGALELKRTPTDLLSMFPYLFGVMILAFPFALLTVFFQWRILGNVSDHSSFRLFEGMGANKCYLKVFAIVVVEEIFARWLFLEAFAKMNLFSGTLAFYFLFLIGNSIWSLLHLVNFGEEKDRKILRVLPQFVSGIFFAFVFVKFGLLATILTHFACNALFFACHKTKPFDSADYRVMAYNFSVLAFSYALINKPFSEVLPWFASVPKFRLEAWAFWDYALLSIFFSALLSLIFDLLHYDRSETEKKGFDSDRGIVDWILESIYVTGSFLFAYDLLADIIVDIPSRFLVMGLVLSFLCKTESFSAIARVFWICLIEVYLAMCVLLAIGFWWGILWLVFRITIEAPKSYLLNLESHLS